jgi:phosphoribosylanthranilate isomerase
LSGFKPDVLQTDWTDLRQLDLPAGIDLLPVLRAEPRDTGELPRRLLFEGLASGAGQPCDWTAARRTAGRSELVLAGGLNAMNVAAAIGEVRPFGVDVSTGVEDWPGVKSPLEIANFVLAARHGGRGTVASASG